MGSTVQSELPVGGGIIRVCGDEGALVQSITVQHDLPGAAPDGGGEMRGNMTPNIVIPENPETGTRADSAPVSNGYESLDADGTKKAYEELNAALDALTTTAVQTLDRMVPYLAKMQSLLSQRGADRKKTLKRAGLPAWSKWAQAFAAKLDRSLRTVQDRIRQYSRGRATRASARSTRTGNRQQVKLDARQQAALVKAQLATNELVAALDNGGDWRGPLAEYKKVAVSPAKLESFVDAFGSEPDWKNAFTQLVDALEPCDAVLSESAGDALRAAGRLLGGKIKTEQAGTGDQNNTTAGGGLDGIPIPVAGLRFAAEKTKAASKRRKPQEQEAGWQAVAPEGSSAGPTKATLVLGPKEGGVEILPSHRPGLSLSSRKPIGAMGGDLDGLARRSREEGPQRTGRVVRDCHSPNLHSSHLPKSGVDALTAGAAHLTIDA